MDHQDVLSIPLLLGQARRGFIGTVQKIDTASARSALDKAELERRLLELGFLEGVKVELLHEGVIGRDPIAVRVDNVTVAIRRREAMAVVVAE